MLTCLLVTFCAQRKGRSIRTGAQTIAIHCNKKEEKNYNCSCKLNTKLILPLTVHFPMWLFRSESQNIGQLTEIRDGEETTWWKVMWIHWADDDSLLRQLRRHYISTWILQECNQMCSQERVARHGCFYNMANKNTLSSFPLTNNCYQTFPRYWESRQYDKFSA